MQKTSKNRTSLNYTTNIIGKNDDANSVMSLGSGG